MQWPEQQGIIVFFLQSAKLMVAQVAGIEEIPNAEVTRWHYGEGKCLVPPLPEVVHALPTQMRRLHDLYMLAMLNCILMQCAKFKDEDFLCGRALYG